MGSYYFNVRDGETLTRDPQPYPFSTLQVARKSAIQIVRELFNASAADESLDERRIEIADETGHPVSFVDADDVRSTGIRLRRNIPTAPPELKI